MLEQVAHFNDLSPKLRDKLGKRIESFGEEVKYRFDISHENPDPLKESGKIIWPSIYTLDPIVFTIIDKDEDRKDKSKSKRVGIVKETDEKGIPKSFTRVRCRGQHEGILTLDLTKPEDIEQCAILELHPKVNGSLFEDKKMVPIISRVDEAKEAMESRQKRVQRKEALVAASGMDLEELKEFAAAMNWNPNEKADILRDKIEEHAEKYPEMFNDLVKSDKLKYQSVVKNALLKRVLAYDPVGGRWTYGANGELIVVLPPNGSQNEIEQMGDFLRTNGQKSDQIFSKIKSLLKI